MDRHLRKRVSRDTAAAESRVQPVIIVLSDFVFTPQNLRLHHGQAQQLRLVNRGWGGHNLSARQFFTVAQINPGDAAAVAGGKVKVGKGKPARCGGRERRHDLHAFPTRRLRHHRKHHCRPI